MFSKTKLVRITLRGLVLASVVAIAGLPALADDDEKRVKPRYDRGESQRPPTRNAVKTPALPGDLVIDTPNAETKFNASPGESAGRVGRTRPDRGHPPQTPLDEHEAVGVVGLAMTAASWTAAELAETTGRRQYYRVGLYRGIRAALRDDSLGTWDYIEGRRSGRRDLAARDLGSDLGSRAAEDAVVERAEARVERQFRDLTREPVFAPLFDPPTYAVEGTWVAEPTLREVFNDFPPSRVPGVGRRVDRALAEWRWDAWRLHECTNYASFYDSGWRDPARAFDFWASESGRARVFRTLDADERVIFKTVFREEFPRALAPSGRWRPV